MSHQTIHRFIAQVAPEHGRVLEVGALDVNPDDPRYGAFPRFGDDYIGVDMREGANVDVVANAHSLPFDDASFDCVVSSEMLEHDDAFWLSMSEMGRVLKPGGALILTARGNGCPEHGCPSDYYRFMPQAVKVLYDLAGCDLTTQQDDTEYPGFLAYGVKRCPGQ